MKNLLDELRKLDKYDYNVSSDFKDQVMSEIKKKNILRVTKYAISALSCACILGISVFFVSKNPEFKGLISRINSKIDSGINNSASSISSSTYDAEMVEETSSVAGLESQDSYKYDDYEREFKGAINEALNVAPSANEKAYDIKEESLDVEEVVSKQDTFSKLMSKKDYMDEIASVLKKNNFKYTKNDDSIVIDSINYNAIYKAIENYVDVTYTISGDKIILDF